MGQKLTQTLGSSLLRNTTNTMKEMKATKIGRRNLGIVQSTNQQIKKRGIKLAITMISNIQTWSFQMVLAQTRA